MRSNSGWCCSESRTRASRRSASARKSPARRATTRAAGTRIGAPTSCTPGSEFCADADRPERLRASARAQVAEHQIEQRFHLRVTVQEESGARLLVIAPDAYGQPA